MAKTIELDASKCASAKSFNLPISSRQSTEIGRFLRYRSVEFATRTLQEVVALRTPVPYRRHVFDLGHKPGIGPGRFPQKAAREFLRVILGAQKNAQFKGLNTASLKIVKLISHKASIPPMAGRHRHAGRRTHLEVVVAEMKASTKSASKSNPRSTTSKATSKKAAAPKADAGEGAQ